MHLLAFKKSKSLFFVARKPLHRDFITARNDGSTFGYRPSSAELAKNKTDICTFGACWENAWEFLSLRVNHSPRRRRGNLLLRRAGVGRVSNPPLPEGQNNTAVILSRRRRIPRNEER